jgi:hypothetical protein
VLSTAFAAKDSPEQLLARLEDAVAQGTCVVTEALAGGRLDRLASCP